MATSNARPRAEHPTVITPSRCSSRRCRLTGLGRAWRCGASRAGHVIVCILCLAVILRDLHRASSLTVGTMFRCELTPPAPIPQRANQLTMLSAQPQPGRPDRWPPIQPCFTPCARKPRQLWPLLSFQSLSTRGPQSKSWTIATTSFFHSWSQL